MRSALTLAKITVDVGAVAARSERRNSGTFGVRYLSHNGPAIVFVHGWLHSSLIWNRISPEMISNHSVILLDLPGFGKAPIAGYEKTREEVGRDLISVLRGLDTTNPIRTIVADSLGGVLFLCGLEDTAWLAEKHVFLSGIPFDGLPFLARIVPIATLMPLSIRLVQLAPSGLGKFLVKSNQWFTVERQSAVGDEIYESVMAADPRASRYFFRMMLKPLERRRLVNIFKGLKKVIVTRGQFDRVATRATTQKWAKIIDAEDCEVPGVGHTPMIEASQFYYRSVMQMSC